MIHNFMFIVLSTPDSKVIVMSITTNEELFIATDTMNLTKQALNFSKFYKKVGPFCESVLLFSIFAQIFKQEIKFIPN